MWASCAASGRWACWRPATRTGYWRWMRTASSTARSSPTRPRSSTSSSRADVVTPLARSLPFDSMNVAAIGGVPARSRDPARHRRPSERRRRALPAHAVGALRPDPARQGRGVARHPRVSAGSSCARSVLFRKDPDAARTSRCSTFLGDGVGQSMFDVVAAGSASRSIRRRSPSTARGRDRDQVRAPAVTIAPGTVDAQRFSSAQYLHQQARLITARVDWLIGQHP